MVGLEWEEEEEDVKSGLQEVSAPTYEEALRLELRKVVQQEAETHERLLSELEFVKELSLRKNAILEQLDVGVGQAREELLKPEKEGGTEAALISVDPEDQDRLCISACDLFIRAVDAWNTNCSVLGHAVTPPVVSMVEITGRLERIADIFDRGGGRSCVGTCVTPEQWETLSGRHKELAKRMVGQPKVTKLAQEMLPKQESGAILKWYGKLEVALALMEQQRAKERETSIVISRMLDRYPGPSFEPSMSPREDQRRPRVEPEVVSTGSYARVGNIGAYHGAGSIGAGSARPLRDEPSLTESEVRRVAYEAGRNFRMGGSGPPIQDGGGPHSLSESLVKRVQQKESRVGSGASVVATRHDDAGTDYGSYEESAWRGEDDADIRKRIRKYATDFLELRGKFSTIVLEIVMKNLAPFRYRLTKSHQASIVRSFNAVAKQIKPACTDIFISMAEWWKMINARSNDYGWAPTMRVRFLANTGGLPSTKEYLVRQERVKSLIHQIHEWMPRFDESVEEDMFEYWTFVWVDVGLKLIEEFHQVQPTEMIEAGLQAYMKQPEHKIDAYCDNFLNTQFHKVHAMFVAMNVWLRERSSALVGTPLWTWRILEEWLVSQTPAGPLMMVQVKDALRKLSMSPELVFPVNHNLSNKELQQVRELGGVNPTERVYELVLRKLKQRALEGDLKMEASTMSQFTNLLLQAGGRSGGGGGSGRQRSGNGRMANSVSTDVSTLTMNTVSGGGGRGGAASGAQKFTPCSTCSMFHRAADDGKCPLVDSKGRHRQSAMMSHRSTTEIGREGKKRLSEYWRKKYLQFLFPKLKYSDAEADNAIKDLRDAIEKQPKASRAEIEKFAQAQVLYANLAKEEDNTHIRALIREKNFIVNYVRDTRGGGDAQSGSGKTTAGRSNRDSGSRKTRRSQQVEEESSDGSSDEDGSDWSDRS
jgi:hypothetical protein